MDKLELLDIIAELIVINSNIGAIEDEAAMIGGVEDVMNNIGENDGDVTILFEDGKAMKITVE